MNKMQVKSGIVRLHVNKNYSLDFLISIAENRNLQMALKFEIKDEFERVCKKSGITVVSEETTDMFANTLVLSLSAEKFHWFKVKEFPFLLREAVGIVAKLLKPYGFYPLAEDANIVTFTTLADLSKGVELSGFHNNAPGFVFFTVGKQIPRLVTIYFGTDDHTFVDGVVEELVREINSFLQPYKTSIMRDFTNEKKLIFGKSVALKAEKLSSKTNFWYSYREWLYSLTSIFNRIIESKGYFLKKNIMYNINFIHFWYTQLPTGIRKRALYVERSIVLRQDKSHSFSIKYGTAITNTAELKNFVYQVLINFRSNNIGLRQKSDERENDQEITVYEFFMLNEFDKLKDVKYLFDHVFVILIERFKEKGIRLYHCDWVKGCWFVVDKPNDVDTIISHNYIRNSEKVAVYAAWNGFDAMLAAFPDENVAQNVRSILQSYPKLVVGPKKTVIFPQSKHRFIRINFNTPTSQGPNRWVYIFGVLAILKPTLAQLGLQMVHQMKLLQDQAYHVTFEKLGYAEVLKPGLTTDIQPLPGIIVVKFNTTTKSSFEVFIGLDDTIAVHAIDGIRGALNELLSSQQQTVTYKEKMAAKLPFGHWYGFRVCDLAGKPQKNKSKKKILEWINKAEQTVEKYLSIKKKGFTRDVLADGLNTFVVYQGYTVFATVS